ncbi:MAG: GTP-binding protein, partial [Bradymonadia bacterium]
MNQKTPLTILLNTVEKSQPLKFESGYDTSPTTIIVSRDQKIAKAQVPNIKILPTVERVQDLGTGCSCCIVRIDLQSKLRALTEKEPNQRIVVQVKHTSDVEAVFKSLTVADGKNAKLENNVFVDGVVTLVNNGHLLKQLNGPNARSVVHAIERADLVVIDTTDKGSPQTMETVFATIKSLNPTVNIQRKDSANLDLFTLNRSFFQNCEDAMPTPTSPLLVQSKQYYMQRITHLNYEETRPFHPLRLYDFIFQKRPEILRITGTFWVASRMDLVG